jgi:hypothetical protein
VKDAIREHYESLSDEELQELRRRVRKRGNKLSRYSKEQELTFLTREMGLDVTLSTVSGFEEVEKGVPLFDSLAAPDSDPLNTLIVEEQYSNVRKRLLDQGERLAAGVLRLMVYPDAELVGLCEKDAREKRRNHVRLTNNCLAARFGVLVSRVADAKATMRAVFKELSGG